MKTKNGNNKLERLRNKAKKYIDVFLTEFSNQYLRVNTTNELVVLAYHFEPVCTKYGAKYKVQLINHEKPIGVSNFAAIETNEGLVFKLYKPSEEVLNYLKKFDDLYRVKDYPRAIKVKVGGTNWKTFELCRGDRKGQ